MQTPLHLGDKLLRPAPQQQGTRPGALTVLENVEPLAADLAFLEFPAGAEVLVFNVGAGGLDRPPDGLDDAFQVVMGDPAGTKDIPIRKVLRGEVPDRQPGEDDLGPRGDDRLELTVDDLPLGIDDRLVLRYLVHADLGVVLFGLEFELDVEAEDARVGELLGLLLESGVGKGFLERDASDQERVLHTDQHTPSTQPTERTCIPPPGTFLTPIKLSSRSSWSSIITASTTISEKNGFCE